MREIQPHTHMRRSLLRWLLLALLPRWCLTAAGSPAEDTEKPFMCQALDDPNGRWEGSRAVGGRYTLRCAPGFEVSGRGGHQNGTIVCPENLEWPEELQCENINNCETLKHGCGAKGLCIDLVNGYDCNCEKGYPQSTLDGEVVCGDVSDERECGGGTCGAYGLCIDLKGSFPAEDAEDEPRRPGHAERRYRCECADGFVDNGTTCIRRDCGALHDELGTWSGSTLFDEEYRLECPENSFVWGYAGLRDLTIRCSRKGDWLSKPVCHSPQREAKDAQVETLRFWTSLACVVLCISSAALAAGLTLGLATLEPFGLTVVMATSEEHCKGREAKEKLRRDQVNSRLVLPLVRDHHRLLVTLMLFNTVANESLPIFLDELVPSWAAVLVSVTAVLICGEIIPSAIFTGPSQMRIAGTCVPLVKFLQWFFHYISKPIIALLDHLIEHEDDAEGTMKYSRAELRALLQLHCQKASGDEDSIHGQKAGVSEESSNTFSMTSATGALSCLLGGHSEERPHEPRRDDDSHDAGPSILASSELRLINGAFDLQEISLDEIPYAKRRHCALGNREDDAATLLKLNMLGVGQRAVLVLKGTSSASNGQQRLTRSSTSGLRCPLVATSEVCGCLPVRDIVHGGCKKLGSLCSEPLVLVPDFSTALEALRLLSRSGSSLGVVIHGTQELGTVEGVVSAAELLGAMLSRRRRASSAGAGAEPAGPQEPADPHAPLPSPGRRHRGRRPLLSRSSSSLEATWADSAPVRRPCHRAHTATAEGLTPKVDAADATARRFSA